MEQEDTRTRHKSGSVGDSEPASASSVSSTVNSMVLDTFRAQSIHKGTNGQNGASRQAAIAAKKAGTPKKAMTPVKPDILPKPLAAMDPRAGEVMPESVVILRKQPRILEPCEIKARVGEQSKGRLLSPLPPAEASKPCT
jgi:hypothetical protein